MRVLGPPTSPPVVLDLRPQVLSWDAADSPMQQRLIPYREEIQRRFEPHVGRPGLALDLSCGLGDPGKLEDVGDLDNFLGPVAYALGTGGIVAAWASKQGGNVSSLAVGEPSELVLDESDGWRMRTVRTTVSTALPAWKEQVGDQLLDLTPPVSPRPIELVLGFRVGPGRNWVGLWKPAIDALESIVGCGPRRFYPRDGLIVRLGLSRAIDEALGWAVEIDITWRPAVVTSQA